MISIIIPCYNASPYIKKSIETLKNQTNKQWEAIYINDGSNDDTFSLLEHYTALDPRFKICTQENRGAAKAREYGITKAIGDYITFLDVDDTLTPNAIEELYNKTLLNPDIIVTGFNIIKDNKLVKKKKISFIETDNISYLKDVLVGKYGLELCGKAFHRNLFDNNPIKTPHNIRIGEDGIVFIQLILKAKKIIGFNTAIYNYIQHSSSTSHTKSTQYAEEAMKAAMVIEEILTKEFFYKNIKDEISSMFLLFYSTSTFKGYLNKKHKLIKYMAHNHLRLKPLLKIPFAKSIYVLLTYYTNGYIVKYAENLK